MLAADDVHRKTLDMEEFLNYKRAYAKNVTIP
jgi:hypothetical protein